MADKKISPIAKYSIVTTAILTTLLLFSWFGDRGFFSSDTGTS